jgi:outer membrane protein assembly complex protein YaeT
VQRRGLRRRGSIAAWVLLASLVSRAALAVTVEDVPEDVAWRVASIEIDGNEAVSASDIEKAMTLKERSWWALWRKRPEFDATALGADLDRIKRVYETHGYYATEVTYDLELDRDDERVTVLLFIAEGPPVIVEDVTVTIHRSGPARPDGPPDVTVEAEAVMPVAPGVEEETPEYDPYFDEHGIQEEMALAEGDVFVEKDYQESEKALSLHFADRGHAHIETSRKAEVDREAATAKVHYGATPGPVAVFGETTVQGLEKVDEELVLRELTYEPGQQFAAEPLAVSRDRILALDVFRAVRFTPQLDAPDPKVVPILIEVEEKPPRNVRIGAGYGTFEGIRGQVQWRHPNWLGGGRQLTISLIASQITLGGDVTFVQPYLFGRRAERGIVSARIYREDWETYTLASTSVLPRLEHRFAEQLVGFFGWRVDYDDVSKVDRATQNAIGGVIERGFLSAPEIGLVWTTTDDPLDPTQGHSIALGALQGGEVWGGAWSFWRGWIDLRKYQLVGWRTVLAGRIKIGLADSIGPVENLPIFERFYAGGLNSVRGYGRRRLGPLSRTNRPLGGRSLFEGSIEARRPIWGAIGGAVFLDFGQVSLDAFDPPVDDLQFAPGFGVTYDTPIGPLRLDIGFPIDPPPSDAAWQLHFSIGQFF